MSFKLIHLNLIVALTPRWENETEEFSTWQHQILDEQYLQLEGNNLFEDLLP